jgi:hypothetical protein
VIQVGASYKFLFFIVSLSPFVSVMQSLKHNPNGRFVVVCGDGEYIIYTALAWRNRSFGSALEFAWSNDGEYAVRESTSKIKIFNKSFQVCSLSVVVLLAVITELLVGNESLA